MNIFHLSSTPVPSQKKDANSGRAACIAGGKNCSMNMSKENLILYHVSYIIRLLLLFRNSILPLKLLHETLAVTLCKNVADFFVRPTGH